MLALICVFGAEFVLVFSSSFYTPYYTAFKLQICGGHFLYQ